MFWEVNSYSKSIDTLLNKEVNKEEKWNNVKPLDTAEFYRPNEMSLKFHIMSRISFPIGYFAQRAIGR